MTNNSTFDDLLKLVKEKEDPYSYIANFIPACFWLDAMYLELFKTNQIKALKDLPEEKKRFYWGKTNAKRDVLIRILSVRAMVAYDFVK